MYKTEAIHLFCRWSNQRSGTDSETEGEDGGGAGGGHGGRDNGEQLGPRHLPAHGAPHLPGGGQVPSPQLTLAEFLQK